MVTLAFYSNYDCAYKHTHIAASEHDRRHLRVVKQILGGRATYGHQNKAAESNKIKSQILMLWWRC